jgi:drug/metabolite transporter (DMT)-like permease
MGLVLIFLTGVVWGGIGIVLGFVARRRWSVLAFMSAATTLAALGAWAFLAHWPSLLAGHVPRALPLVLLLTAAGIVGTVGMLCLQRAMTAGAAGWTVGQSAMVIPFVVGILFLGEPPRLAGMLGLSAILGSLVAFSCNRRAPVSGSAADPGWFRQALLALLLLGIQQSLCMIPSSWEGWTDTARLRIPLVLISGAAALLAVSAKRRLCPEHGIWLLATLYAALVVGGQVLLFAAMDRLRAEDRLALAYPIAIGVSMVAMALCERWVWRNRPTRSAWAGILLGLLGVILLASL